jgi:hypothetical protein
MAEYIRKEIMTFLEEMKKIDEKKATEMQGLLHCLMHMYRDREKIVQALKDQRSMLKDLLKKAVPKGTDMIVDMMIPNDLTEPKFIKDYDGEEYTKE